MNLTSDGLTFTQAITPFGFVAYAFNALAIVISLYFLFIKVGIHPKRCYVDKHYRLRLILCNVLLVVRILDFSRLFIITKMDQRGNLMLENYEQDLIPYGLAQFGLYFFVMTGLYIELFLMYLLTIDRYKRVTMVLNTSRMNRVIQCCTWMLAVQFTYIVVGYGMAYLSYFFISTSFEKLNATTSFLVSLRKLMEMVAILQAIGLDCFFTLYLIRFSTHTVLGSNQDLTYQKRQLFVNMVCLFALISLIDLCSILGEAAIFTKWWKTSATEYESIHSTILSWIPLRVFLVYTLLDLFLVQLHHVQNVGRRNRLQKFLDSMVQSLTMVAGPRNSLPRNDDKDSLTFTPSFRYPHPISLSLLGNISGIQSGAEESHKESASMHT